ncbi:MAG: hypothetical protein ACSHX6_07435 [Akkermansiaceae bacterium]
MRSKKIHQPKLPYPSTKFRKLSAFKDEYLNLLKKLNIDYDSKHIWPP